MFSFKQHLLESNDVEQLCQALDELGVEHSVHYSRPGYFYTLVRPSSLKIVEMRV